jgi:hypothetical protein
VRRLDPSAGSVNEVKNISSMCNATPLCRTTSILSSGIESMWGVHDDIVIEHKIGKAVGFFGIEYVP